MIPEEKANIEDNMDIIELLEEKLDRLLEEEKELQEKISKLHQGLQKGETVEKM
ncbi:hypothetical protein ES703_81819 [subsurface metagenome]